MQQQDDERIRARAYEIWEASGCPEGAQDSHWQQAQSEVMAKDAYGLEPETVQAMQDAAAPAEVAPPKAPTRRSRI